MKKSITIGIVILLLIGVGAFLFLKNKSPQNSSGQVTERSASPKTLKEIFGLGLAQKCTYGTGVVYVSDGKMRGDFTAPPESPSGGSHMIVVGNTSYIWMDGSKTGFKNTFNLDATPPPSTSTEEGSQEPVDLSQPEDYVCENWVVDSSLFDLPAGVSFTDINEMMPDLPSSEAGTSGTSSQCSYCDSLSGTDKSDCLSALKCQ